MKRITTYRSRNLPPIFRLEDAYVFTGEIPPPTVVQAYIPPVDTLGDGLSWTGVMNALDKGPEMPAERPSRVPRVPVWSVACVFSGSVLMAVGWMLNEPVARLIWEAIPR
jgi:hypothetical protein